MEDNTMFVPWICIGVIMAALILVGSCKWVRGADHDIRAASEAREQAELRAYHKLAGGPELTMEEYRAAKAAGFIDHCRTPTKWDRRETLNVNVRGVPLEAAQ